MQKPAVNPIRMKFRDPVSADCRVVRGTKRSETDINDLIDVLVLFSFLKFLFFQ